MTSQRSGAPGRAISQFLLAHVIDVVAWASVLAALSITMAWPFLHRAVLLSDDAEMLLAHLGDPFQFHGWDRGFFRPLDTLSAALINPSTRDAQVSLLLHIPALAAIGAAVFVVLRDRYPTSRLAAPIALMWWLLSVGTTIALWQPDLVSQTWGAAVGIWLAIVLWFGAREAATGSVANSTVLKVSALTAAGVLTREFFFGWALGGVALLALFVASQGVPRRESIVAWVRLAAPVIVIPAVFLLLRIYAGGLGHAIAGEDATGGRYDLELGSNVVVNLAITGLGMTAIGPAHMVDNPDALLPVRIAPLLGSGMTIALIASPWLLSRLLGTGREHRPDLRTVALVLMISLSGIAPAIPTQHVSEYYLFGPNVGTALLIGMTIPASWRVIRGAPQGGARSTSMGVFGAILALSVFIGLAGSVSRARHIDLNWQAVRGINTAVTRLYSDAGGLPAFDVYVPQTLTAGPTHGVFVSTPAHLYDFSISERYFNERFEQPKVHFVYEGSAVPPSTPLYELDVVLAKAPDW